MFEKYHQLEHTIDGKRHVKKHANYLKTEMFTGLQAEPGLIPVHVNIVKETSDCAFMCVS